MQRPLSFVHLLRGGADDMWTVLEQGKDGLYRRAAEAHIWQWKKDADKQRVKLKERHPGVRFVIQKLKI